MHVKLNILEITVNKLSWYKNYPGCISEIGGN